MDYLTLDNLNKPLAVTVVLLVVVIILLIYIVHQKQKYFHNFLNGVWSMDEEFCEESGLNSGYLAIDEDNGYLVLHVEGEEVINEPIKIGGTTKFNPDLNGDNNIFLTIDSESTAINSLYPDKLHCIVNLLEGVMIWKNEEETLAIFYKINSS